MFYWAKGLFYPVFRIWPCHMRQRLVTALMRSVHAMGALVFKHHTLAPNSRPTPAVMAMAKAPQKITRTAPFSMGAPPA
jgi:hypothetical protein